MRALSGRGRDLLLGLFAVLVLAGAVEAVRVGGATAGPATSSAALVGPGAPASGGHARPSASPSGVTPSPATAAPVLVVGPDLSRLVRAVAAGLGAQVESAQAAPPEVLAPQALDAVDVVPAEVVLQVVAGSRTTARTSDALRAVQARWPAARLFVVGPFGAQDRKSAAAAEAAAKAAGATFLDPVGLRWRTADAQAALTAADRTAVAARLVSALR